MTTRLRWRERASLFVRTSTRLLYDTRPMRGMRIVTLYRQDRSASSCRSTIVYLMA